MSLEPVLIPIKRFDRAKERLRRVENLDVDALARALARAVILSCAPRPVVVLSEDDEVTAFARQLGAGVRRSSATGLNEAVHEAYRDLGEEYRALLIAHGDLREPEGLGTFPIEPGVTLFADHRGEGTNVLALPTGLDFHFGYGPRSLAHHVSEARRLGQPYRVVLDSPWRFDVDEPDDLPTLP